MCFWFNFWQFSTFLFCGRKGRLTSIERRVLVGPKILEISNIFNIWDQPNVTRVTRHFFPQLFSIAIVEVIDLFTDLLILF